MFERCNTGEQQVHAGAWWCRIERHRAKMGPGLGFGGDHGSNIS